MPDLKQRFTLPILCFLTSIAVLQAADKRTCRIIFLGGDAPAPAGLHLFDGSSFTPVEVSKTGFSPTYRISGGQLLLQISSAASGTPDKPSPDAPSLSLPVQVTDFYLILNPDPDNKDCPFKMELIDTTKLANGAMIWCNKTPFGLEGSVGNNKLNLAANSRQSLAAPVSADGDYVVDVFYRKPGNDLRLPLFETKWRHDTRARSVFFAIVPPDGRDPRIIGFKDRR